MLEMFFMVSLVLTSLVGVTFIIERGIALRWKKVIPPAVSAAVNACQSPEDLPSTLRIFQQYPSSLSRLLLVAAEHLDWPKAENIDAVQTHARQEIVKLERGLVILEIVVGIAPLLGLVGTVFGMITLFGDLGRTGLTDSSALATGIGLILNSTLLGLLIAIPSLIAWNYYNNKVEMMAVELEALCTEFMRRQYRRRKED
jgi:biopolymer transport protein ExbB